jgi:hypothetical protein
LDLSPFPFAVLRHESPRGLHWDFFLESGGVLRAWSLPALPAPAVELTCEALADHRLAYLDYEGPISEGRGAVTRWDRGRYSVCREDADELLLDLSGTKLSGHVSLRPVPGQPRQWRFLWTPGT